MIKINDKQITQDAFSDGTLKIDHMSWFVNDSITVYNINWCYDYDVELFTLICIVDYIREINKDATLNLYMPYIPNARQDRFVTDRMFTLRTFINIINKLNFEHVFVADPHSSVSVGLLERSVIDYTPVDIHAYHGDDWVIMVPDIGAAKRYSDILNEDEIIIGMKRRDADGGIEKFELLNFKEGTKNVIIRDDVCSYGYTCLAAVKALKERGVEHVDLCVTHLEDRVLEGDLINEVDTIYTTDSIFHLEHPKIKIMKRYR